MAAGKHEAAVNKMTLDPGARYCAQQIDLHEARLEALEKTVAECCKGTLRGPTPDTDAKPGLVGESEAKVGTPEATAPAAHTADKPADDAGKPARKATKKK